MRHEIKAVCALLVSEMLVLAPLGCGHRSTPPKTPVAPSVFNPLQKELQEPYLTLFDEAPTLEYSSTQVEKMKEYLDKTHDYCVGEFEQKAEQHDRQIEQAQQKLKEGKKDLSDQQRHELHCRIQNQRALKTRRNCWPSMPYPSLTKTRKRNSN